MARRTKQNIENHRGIKELISTNLSPQGVARVVFLAIQRLEYCSRMFIDEYHCMIEGIDAPSSFTLRCQGTWAEVMGHD